MRRRWIWYVSAPVLLAAVVLSMVRGKGDAPPHAEASKTRLRRPVALVTLDAGKRLGVANRRAGSVSLIDVNERRVIAETTVGCTLADLKDAGDGRLFAVDEAAGELIVLSREGDRFKVASRLRVGASPVSVRALSATRAAVACLWPRLLVLVEGDPPRIQKRIPLPFAPRCQLVLPGEEKIVVADAFGGRLAVVDAKRGAVESVRSVPGHNIRGMALSADGKSLLLSHQVLAEDTPTQADDVRWGNVITNNVRSLALEDIVNPDADLLRHARLFPLGEFLHGAADPAGLAIIQGKMLVTLAGTGELAFESDKRGDWTRIAVGRRPTALAVTEQTAFVADTFGDAMIVMDIPKRQKIATISLGPTPDLSPAERGERLFFDGRLSKEGWMSCHSCHSDGHTNGLRSDTLGDGSYGAPKRVPTLLGVGDTAPWAWNGSLERLEDQVRQSIQSTMRGSRPSDEQVTDLTAYLRTLKPPPASGSAVTEAVRRGEGVFQSLGCNRCHAPPTYTTPKAYDVGLPDEFGKKLFNPPSLRGVGHGVAFFHDGRATRLEEVFTRHHHQVPADLPRKELDDLLAFLRTL